MSELSPEVREPMLISGMRRHPTGEVRHIPDAPIGMCGTSTAGFLWELGEYVTAAVEAERRQTVRDVLADDDEMTEDDAAGVWMHAIHGGDTGRTEDWQEAYAEARTVKRPNRDQYDLGREAERARTVNAVEAVLRTAHHNDTCATALSPAAGYPCSCTIHAVRTALASAAPALDAVKAETERGDRG